MNFMSSDKTASQLLVAARPRALTLMIAALVASPGIVTPRSRTTSVAGVPGVGFNVGRAELGLRYVAFGERLGSSRGRLPLSLAWRF